MNEFRKIAVASFAAGRTVVERIAAACRLAARRSVRFPRGPAPWWEQPSVLLAAGLVAAFAALKLLDPLAFRRLPLDWGGFVDDLIDHLSSFGTGAVLLVGTGSLVLAAAWLAGSVASRRFAARLFRTGLVFGFVFASVAVSGLIASLAKNLFGRARPGHVVGDRVFEIEARVFSADWAAFPSGHATTAGASAMALALLFPEWRRPFLIFGAVVAATRVAMGAHFPSDVLAGFALGVAFTLALAHLLAVRGLVFRHRADGSLAPRAEAEPKAWFDLLADLLARRKAQPPA